MLKEKKRSANEETVPYELGLHLVPTIAEENTEAEFNSIIKLIESKGGEVTSSSKPAFTKLAYQMIKNIDSKNHRHDTAYFSWIKFNSDAEAVGFIKEELDSNNNILRFIIIKPEEGPDISSEEVAAILNGQSEGQHTEKDSEEENSDDTNKDKKSEDSDKSSKSKQGDDVSKEDEEAKEDESKSDKKPDKKQSIEEVDKVIDEMVA